MDWRRSSWARTRALGSRARARVRFRIGFRGFFLESVGEGDGEGVVVVLEKKAVIWRCGFTIGDLPLLCLRDGAIFSIFILFFAASREVETEHTERAN